MKLFFRKCFWFISIAAFFLLNITSDRKISIIGCLITIAVIGIYLVKKKADFLIHTVFVSRPACSLLSVLICTVLACNFYDRQINSDIIRQLAEGMEVEAKLLLILLAAAGAIAAFPIVVTVTVHYTEKGIQNFRGADDQTSGYKRALHAGKAFGILTILYGFGISAIIRANFNYIDDMARCVNGERGWDNFSRFISEGLSVLIYTDRYITDISPLMQVMAIAVLALAGIILIYILYERTAFTIWEIIVLIPLGLNPYFLECLSFKFDALFMAVSVLGAIVPLLYRSGTSREYILASFIGTMVVCMSYQASSGIFPMLVVFLALRMWMKKTSYKQIAEFCLKSVAGYGIGLIFFRVVVMLPLETDTYVSAALPEIFDLVPTILKNLKYYFSLIIQDFRTIWKGVLLLLGIGSIWAGCRRSERKKGASFAVICMTEGLMLLMCFGVYPVLEKSSFSPRCMYGFGVFITILCLAVAEIQQCVAVRTPAIVISWMFFTFAFTYGNSLYVQKQYTDFRITQVITDLNDMDIFLGENPVTVQIAGSIGHAPALQSLLVQYPVLDRLVPVTFAERWVWGGYGFYNYYGLKNIVKDESKDLTEYDLPLIMDSMYHSIYGNEENVLVKLK